MEPGPKLNIDDDARVVPQSGDYGPLMAKRRRVLIQRKLQPSVADLWLTDG
jgi:hypothetical protein